MSPLAAISEPVGNPLPRCPAPSTGFTLVELLVVLAIVAVLAALLLPSLRMLRDSALGTRCMANLRQIAAAAGTYADDWSGMVVPGYTGSISYQYWYHLIAEYTGEKDIVDAPDCGRIVRGCPAWRSTEYFRSLPVGGWEWQQYPGYTETQFLLPVWRITSGGTPPYPFGCTFYDPAWGGTTLDNPLVMVTRPGQRPYFADAAQKPVDMISWDAQAIYRASFQRHRGRGNVLFFDAHGEPMSWQSAGAAQNLDR